MIHHSFELHRLIQTPLALEALGTACLIFGLGILAVKRDQSSAESLAFSKLMGSMGLWLFGFSWMYASRDADAAYWWAKIGYIGIALIPAAAFELSTLLVPDFHQAKKTAVHVLWTASFFFMVAILATDFQFGSMYRYSWGFYPRYTVTSLPFVLYYAIVLTAVFNRYYKAYRTARPGSRQQRVGRLPILACMVTNIGLVDYLPSFGIAVYPFGFSVVILFALILY